MSDGRWTFKAGVDRVNRLEPKIVLTVNRQMRSGRLDFCELTEAEALTLAEELLHASNREIMRQTEEELCDEGERLGIEDIPAIADEAAKPYADYCDGCSGALPPDHFRLYMPDGETRRFHDRSCIRDWSEP